MYLHHPATRIAFFCLLTSLLAFTPAPAQDRYALAFDGDGDYVTFDSTPDFGEAYTVELWFQTTETSTVQYLFAITDASSNSHYMMLRVESDGRIRFLHRAPAASSGGTSIYYDATDVRDGQWHHVAAVKDAAGLTLYFDGTLAATATDASSIGDFATSGVVGVLGQQKHNSDIQPFTGEMDEVRIWSEARSQAQIADHMGVALFGIEAQLAAYWPFDEGSGTTSTDASGNGHDATLNGTLTWTLSDVVADPVLASDDVPGTALAFDGVDDYVQLPGKRLIDPAAGTLELWFRAEGVSQTQMLIHGGENSANGFGGEEELHVNITSGGVIDFGAYGGDDPWRLTGTTLLTADTYHHVAAQWSEADGTVNLYLDGQLEATGSYAAFSTATWEDFLRLGVNNAASRLFAGQMDEVRLWNVARTEQQIQEAMHRTLDDYEDGLVAYYQFNDAAGTTLTDIAGGNDGTLTNMDDADWEASTLTTGRGVSVVADVSFTGEVAITEADLTLSVTEAGEALVATRYDATPAIVPTWAAFAQVYDDRFWLLDPIGATPTAGLTFDLGESVSSYDPFQFKLFHRENDLAAEWTFLAAASAISGTAVTFAEQAAAGQFLVARTAVLDTAVGTMLSFDGVNDYVRADAVTASFGDALTLEAWVRPDDTQDERGAIFGINTTSGGNVLLLFYNEGTFEHYDTDYHPTDALFPGNTWYHVALTVAEGNMQLYVDGALVLEHAHTTTFSATDQFSLGQEWDNTTRSNEFGGDMDDVRLWNIARTQAEIQATMHTPLTGTEDGLVAYYPLNDDAPGGFAATAADVVGGHDGALMNMVSQSNNISPWETSTIAFGPTDSQAEGPGTVVFTDTGVEITYLSQTGATVTVTRLDEAPATLPSAGTAFADQYWVINRAGSGLFNATLTFTPGEAFTASDEAVPDQIHLYSRPSYGDDWEKVATAAEVDATAGTATFREIRSFSQFLLVRGDVLDAGTVMATEDLYEDRVEITWADMPPDAARLKIFRGDTFLAYAASDDVGYSDTAGDPGVTYEYCVSVVDTFDATLSTACDTGRRLINPPQSLTATDGTLDDAVVLSWTDRSEVEAAYAVYRTEDGLSTALAFDGVDDYVTIAHDGDLDPNNNTGDVTVSAWIYLNNIPDGNATSVAQIAGLWFSNARTGPSNDGSYRLGVAADATLTFQYATSSTSSTLPKADNTLSANTWYFVAATFEANAELVFYVNEDKTVSASTPPALLSSDYDFRLGGPVPGDNGVWESQNPYFDGYISDVRLWNRALSEAEVQDTRTGTLIDDGLIGYWPLDESSGTVATDRAGSHDGTIEGPTWWTQDPLATFAANTSFYTDDTAEEGVPYTYCVVALDADGFASEQACDEGYRGSVLPPLAVSASDGQYPDSVVVAWTPQADNATGFLIERDGVEVATTTADATSYADTGATDSTPHTYCVYTLIDDLASVAVCDEGGIGILAAPSALAASDGTYDDRIRLTWDDPGDTEDGFRVYRIVDTDTVTVTTTVASVTTYRDTSAEPGVAYEYCVAAVSSVSGTDVVSEASCDEGQQSHVLAPTDVAATDGKYEDQVVLTWKNAATTAALLEIYRDSVRIKTTVATSTSYADFKIPSGDTLSYCVAAVTAGGVSSAWSCNNGHRTLAAPTSVLATDNTEEDEVIVTWTDNAEVEAGYQIYRYDAAETETPTLIGAVGANKTTYADQTGVPGLTYTYRVTAFDADGESEGKEDTGTRTLLAPTEVGASDGLSETSVAITWRDNSKVEAGYQVYRIADGDTVLVGTTAARTTHFTDSTNSVTTLVLGTAYTYAVQAFDAYGPSAVGTDEGYTVIFEPTSLNASDTYEDRVVLTWVDVSEIEAGYRVFRDGVEIATTAAGAVMYTDTDAALVAGVEYSYCAEAYTEDGGVSVQACDVGIQAAPVVVETGDNLLNNPIAPLEDGASIGEEIAIDGAYAVAKGRVGTSGTMQAWIFHFDGGEWTQQQELLPPDEASFGPGSASLDGDYAVLGGQNSSSLDYEVYVYQRIGTTWVYTTRILPTTVSGSEPFIFGEAIDLRGDYLIVGDPREDYDGYSSDLSFDNNGAAYIFKRDGNSWNQQARLTPSDTGDDKWFGTSVSISGDHAIVGRFQSGVGGNTNAYVFERDGEDWSQVTTLLHDDANAISSVAIDGEYAVVADGGVYIYRLADDTWAAEPFDFDGAGTAVALDVANGLLLIGEPGESTYGIVAGQVSLFALEGEGWALQEVFREPPSFDKLGTAVDIGGGALIMTGATTFSSTYVVDYLLPPQQVTASDGRYDTRVQLSWEDVSFNEIGYRIYRDGAPIGDTGPDVTSFSDLDVAPGQLVQYCVEGLGYNNAVGEQVCDAGWRPANGAISGRVATPGGAGIDSVALCLDPAPNQALLLDGDGGYAFAEDLHLDADLEAFTVSFWMKTNDTSNDGTPFSYNRDGDDNLLTFFNYDDLRIYVNGEVTAAAGIALNDGQWHHVAATWQSSDGELVLYVDGTEALRVTDHATGTAVPAGGVLVLGQEQDAAGGGFQSEQAFKGQLDEVRFWNTVRDAGAIQADLLQPMTGDEENLVGYWPLDQAHTLGGISPDVTGGNNHLTLVDGAYTTEAAAPLEACAFTDLDGNFTLANIYYGDEATFTLSATKDVRQFDPATKSLSLSTESPVQNEVLFSDVSSFTLTGVVEFPSPFDATTCPAEGVELYVGAPNETLALVATTEKDGVYTLAADVGERTLEPRLTNPEDLDGDGLTHTFSPSSLTLDVNDDGFGLNFLNTTTRTLVGFAGGNCNAAIGPVTLRIFTENGCFDHEVTVEGAFSLDLPPQAYFVQVVDVDPPDVLDRADMIAFFDDLGPQAIDLSLTADTLELIYQAPLEITITGLPGESDNLCAADTQLGVPILTQGEAVALDISVVQDYGTATCEATAGTLTIFDEVALGNPTTEVILDEQSADDLPVAYTLVPGAPNILAGLVVDGIDRSYQKAFTVVAEVDGRDAVTETAWVVVEGEQVRTSEFTTLATEAIPLMVLRDPPGDGSSSFIQQGTKTCVTATDVTVSTLTTNQSTKVTSGKDVWTGTVIGLGTAIVSISSFSNVKTEASYAAEQSVGSGFKSVFKVCTEFTEKVSTSSGDTFVGEDADVLVGTGLNLIFANADVLSVDESDGTCAVSLTETVVGGLDASDPFHTTYAYTQQHIRDQVIPSIEELITATCDEEDETCEASVTDEEDTVIPLEDAIANWYELLQANREAAAQALEGGRAENRSFSAGADYTYTAKWDTSDATTTTIDVFLKGSGTFNNVFKFFGTGTNADLTVSLALKYTTTNTDEEAGSETIGYTLKDNDLGDSFTLDVAQDDRYTAFAFGLRSGITSHPWEPGPVATNAFASCRYDAEDPDYLCDLDEAEGWPFSQPRDNPTLSITPPVQLGVDPDGKAIFTLALGNASESEEAREYKVQALSTANPDGATFKANGGGITGGMAFYVEPGQIQNITLEVGRGPTKYSYDSLAIIAYPPKDFGIWQNGGTLSRADTVYFSVEYEAACSDISLLRPKDRWVYTATDEATGTPIEVILNDFAFSTDLVPDGDSTLFAVGAEYRREGASDWIPIGATQANGAALAGANSLTADWTPPGEGVYELRAFTQCNGATVLSEVATGTVDTAPPLVLGRPQPSDEALHLGDDIALTFNEPVSCSSFVTEGTTTNVFLQKFAVGDLLGGEATGDTLAINLVCDGRTLVIEPTDDLRPLENQRLQAKVLGDDLAPTDLYGNALAEEVIWSFAVRQHQFTWSPAYFDAEIPLGSSAVLEAELINGTALTTNFSLSSVPDFLTTTVVNGELPSGGSQSIPLTLAEGLEIGRYEGTVAATTDQGNAELLVTVDVVCAPPDWAVDPAAYERNMTVIAEVFLEDDSTPAPVGTQVAAYIGTEVRGVGTVEAFDDLGADLLFLNVYDDAEDSDNGDLRFEVWTEGTDAATCRTYTYAETYPDAATTTDTPLTFADDALAGTTTVPVRLIASDPQQAIALAAGWTWFSVNHDYGTDNDLDNVLGSLVLATGDLVKSHADGFATYDASLPGWAGSLTNIELGKGYQIQLAEANTLVLQAGTPVDPSTVEISLSAGWNAIGYLPEATLDLGTALVNLTPTDGDLIKSQTAFAQYDATFDGWIGSLTSLQAGAGYQLYSANGGTFTYPAPAAFEDRTDDLALGAPRGEGVGGDAPALYVSKEGVLHEEAAEVRVAPSGDVPLKRGPYTDAAWAEENPDAARTMRLRAQDYAHTMTLTGVLLEGGVPVQRGGLFLRAFAGDTLRGQAPLRYVATLEAYRVFLTAYSHTDRSDTLWLALYDANTGQTQPLDQHVAFRADARLGSVREPMRLGTEAAPAAAPAEALPETFALHANYPNPFNPRTTIKYDVPAAAKVRLVVYDVLGRVVDILVDGEQKAGFHAVQYDAAHLASGVYFYRLEAGRYRQVHKMTLVK